MRSPRSSCRPSAALVLLAALVLQACVFSSEKPLVGAGDALRLLPDAFVATEEEQSPPQDSLPRVPQVYDARHDGNGTYALVRRDDGATLDVRFADLGGGDLAMMMEWHTDEETPFMYLTARYQAPYLIIDDPEFLADNVEAYRQRFGGDVELVRDGSKYNDSLKIGGLAALRNAIGFYRDHNERHGGLIRYRIEAAGK